jgi:hypothetical protein
MFRLQHQVEYVELERMTGKFHSYGVRALISLGYKHFTPPEFHTLVIHSRDTG